MNFLVLLYDKSFQNETNILLLVISLFLTLSLSSFAQSEQLELEDIFDLEYISSPTISPDGSQVIYVRNFKDIMADANRSNLWICNVDGTNNRPLTTGNQNDRSPAWSPRWRENNLLKQSSRAYPNVSAMVSRWHGTETQ